MQLLAVVREEAPPLEELKCSVRLLVASEDPAEFCAAVEAESLALLKSHDSEGLEGLVAGVNWSPVRALGIVVAGGRRLRPPPACGPGPGPPPHAARPR